MTARGGRLSLLSALSPASPTAEAMDTYDVIVEGAHIATRNGSRGGPTVG